MEYEYSKIMKDLRKKKPGMAIQILLLLLTAVFIAGATYGYLAAKEGVYRQERMVQEFDPLSPSEDYSKLTPVFLSEEYASNYNDSTFYCFAVDQAYNSYIVAIKANNMGKYQEIIDYTYDDTITQVPEAITLKGVPKEMDTELIDMSVDAYNDFIGYAAVDRDTFKFMLGEYYLDTTQGPSTDNTIFTVCLLLAIASLAAYGLIRASADKAARFSKATLDRIDEVTLREVDRELKYTGTTWIQSLNLYITDNYIVSSFRGLDIIPLNEVAAVYGGIYANNKAILTLITKDDVKHEIAELKLTEEGNEVSQQIIDRMKQALPDISYGTEDSFYIRLTPNSGIDVDTDRGDGSAKSNVVFGILGAILGAALGGAIWIIIGMIGFVAGIAGYLMMKFAILGYRKLSGYLDKKGQIISLIIAFLMIFVANYAAYAIEYFKYYYEGNYTLQNLISSFANMSGFLTATQLWGDFAKDLIVGYLLSIWAGFRIIRSVFTRNNATE